MRAELTQDLLVLQKRFSEGAISEREYDATKIELLEKEIQSLEDLLITEFQNGYTQGYDYAYELGYDIGFKDGDIERLW